jgi:hemolysin activation/secretion protein
VNSVRGYPENLLVRDNGVAATLELQLPIFGYRNQPHPLNLVLVPFVDYGRSWDEADTDPGSDIINTDEGRYIYSAGLGLLWAPLRGLDLQAYWGSDLGNNFRGDDPRQFRQKDLQDDGFHFSVSYNLRW